MPPAAERFKTTYQPGQVIFSEGEPGNDLYILLSGCVEVSRDGVQLAVVDKPKSFLGAVSILLGQPRTATVVAQSVCTIFRVPDSDRDDFWKSRPELTLQLARTLARRLSEMNENCVGLMRGELDLQEPQAEPAALSAASAAASAVGENMAEAEEVADGEPSLDSEHMAAAESAPVEPAAGDAPGPYGDDEEEEEKEDEM